MREIQTRKSVTLAATLQLPYDLAFAYLRDPRNLAEWSVNIKSLESRQPAGDK